MVAQRDGPLFYRVKDIALLLGPAWSQRRTRGWLARAGALERRFGTLVTSADRLAIAFPEIYRRLLEDED